MGLNSEKIALISLNYCFLLIQSNRIKLNYLYTNSKAFFFSNMLNLLNENTIEIYTFKRWTYIVCFNVFKFLFVQNGKNIKKIFILKFFSYLKVGEFFFTRAQFSFLKKNKKITKR